MKISKLLFLLIAMSFLFYSCPMLESLLETDSIVQLAAGDAHSLVLTAEGKVYSSGGNENGQLGRTTGEDSDPAFAEVSLSAWAGDKPVAIAAGKDHSLVLTAGGKVYSCGSNSDGQLGRAAGGNSDPAFAEVSLDAWAGDKPVAIAAGSYHSLVLTAAGKVYFCGSNAEGQVSADTLEQLDQFSELKTFSLDSGTVTIVAAGEHHSLAAVGEKLYVTGENGVGQIGLGSEAGSKIDSFTQVNSPPWGTETITAMAGNRHYSLIIAGGSLYGTGTYFNTEKFIEISSLWKSGTVTAIAAGYNHTLVLAGGKLYVADSGSDWEIAQISINSPGSFFNGF